MAYHLRHDPDPVEDPDDDPPAVHYQQQITRTRRLLASLEREQDPDGYARLERELEQWQRLLDAETRDEHWTAGEGDRPLF